MLDGFMRKIIDPPLNGAGKKLAQMGASANGVTASGLVLGLLAALLIAMGNFSAGLFFLLLSRIADGLDGAVARATQKTDFGGYFDIVADFLFYGAIVLAFIVYDQQENGLAGAVLLLSFYFNGATFLGYSILAERNKLSSASRGEKNLYFTDGLLEGTETIAFFVVICIWPNLFALLAYIFAAATFYTAVMRIWRAKKNFPPNPIS
ncbi:Putative phosphatidylglycerophosphate synthase [hydrothermal vent metagenome]|uniref:Phosphatidylglycerophosphate synthase n=1 Tax=hydrothermal vent metagenome TaxID=652676 RepID=A0A3B0TJ29_9ZZZZ